MTTSMTMQLVYLLLLGGAIGGLFLVQFRRRMGEMALMALTWTLIFVGVIAIYGLWNDIRSELLPGNIAVAEGGTIELRRDYDGHFYMRLPVNGIPTRFLVDTGATSLVLARDDAIAAGFDPGGLRYSGRAMTANGEIRTAPVRIALLGAGNLTFRDFPAVVTEGELDTSLLGQTLLSRFDSIEISGDVMALRIGR